jgi:hypothetical protein
MRLSNHSIASKTRLLSKVGWSGRRSQAPKAGAPGVGESVAAGVGSVVAGTGEVPVGETCGVAWQAAARARNARRARRRFRIGSL